MWIQRIVLTSFLAAVTFMIWGCDEGVEANKQVLPELSTLRQPTELKVLIVGIDGASPQIVNRLIAEGRLPYLQELAGSGSFGVLRSEEPMVSPAIWTTIVTGRSRADHGVESFLRHNDPDEESGAGHLVRSTDRRVSTLWNWMSKFDLSAGFNGWWASWPAESVNGWVVSDRLTRSRWSEWTGGSELGSLTYPPGLVDDLLPLVVDAANPPMDEISSLVELTDAERSEFLKATKPYYGHGLSVFKFAYCNQRSYEEISLQMLERGQPDLTGVFLIANDAVSHTFWHYYEPEYFDGVDKQDAARLGALIPSLYDHNDRFLGRLLERIDSNTIVFVVSDHGFRASGILPRQGQHRRFAELRSDAEQARPVAVGQSGIHHLDGLLIVAGPGIRSGVSLDATIFDITPTVLALLGLPVAQNMEGRVLTELIEPEFLSRYPVQSIDSYEAYFRRTETSADEDYFAQGMLDQLQALGYID